MINEGDRLALVLEYCNAKDLGDVMDDQRNPHSKANILNRKSAESPDEFSSQGNKNQHLINNSKTHHLITFSMTVGL